MSCHTHAPRTPRPGWAALTILLGLLAACDAPGVRHGPAPVALESTPAETADAAILAPAIEEEAVIARPARRRIPSQGVVTAGDIDDTLNLAAFRRYQARMAAKTGLPRIDARAPMRVNLRPGVNITLRKPGAAEPFYAGHTGVDGLLTVFPALHGAGGLTRAEMRYFGTDGRVRSELLQAKPDKKRHINLGRQDAYRPDFLDLVFVFDTTGSMGDELAWLTKEFGGIVAEAQRAAPQADLRFGLVAYRDKADAYVVRNFGFTGRKGEMQRWLRSLDASGGGDYPEAADKALMAAVDLPWRRGYGERLIFHVADAPPHRAGAPRYLDAARKAARQNVQIFGLGASGVADEAEFLMRQASVATQGRYLFLTDDSGVGNTHAEPNVACYTVTRLKSLLTRVITSELTGVRQEPRDAEVIRRVGNYRRGVCLQ